jgi:hypothetical protein
VKKIDVKISVVERAIHSIGRDTEVSSNGDRLMLKKFLNTDEYSSDDGHLTLKAQCLELTRRLL